MDIGQPTFHEKKLHEHEFIVREKAFWKMFFATGGIKEVEEFLNVFFDDNKYERFYLRR